MTTAKLRQVNIGSVGGMAGNYFGKNLVKCKMCLIRKRKNEF